MVFIYCPRKRNRLKNPCGKWTYYYLTSDKLGINKVFRINVSAYFCWLAIARTQISVNTETWACHNVQILRNGRSYVRKVNSADREKCTIYWIAKKKVLQEATHFLNFIHQALFLKLIDPNVENLLNFNMIPIYSLSPYHLIVDDIQSASLHCWYDHLWSQCNLDKSS